MLVRGETELAAFRSRWTGERVLDLLRTHAGRLLVGWPVGVGKSHNIDSVIEAAVRSGLYDLVVTLAPTRRLIGERRWIVSPPPDLKIVNLRPRPRRRCGALDAAWQRFERAGLGGLGREQLCATCPRRRGCYWPDQYGKGLKDAQVVFGTQAQLERAPDFIGQVERSAGARRPLVVLDEVNGLMTSFRRRVAREHLERFTEALRRLPAAQHDKYHQTWLDRCDLLQRATTADLRHPDWKMPFAAPPWALAVQAQGWADHADNFRFIAHELRQLGRSPLDSRERTAAGDLEFAAPPYAGSDVIVYSGTAHPELTRFRLGGEVASPFEGYRFAHPDTKWYNIASRLGARSYFPHNADQVLDFFAGLIARRLSEGRRPLLIAKKCFVPLCVRGLTARLRDLGLAGVRFVTTGWRRATLAAPSVIPIINYGAIGTNLFEGFDCAYCLTGYYVTEQVVNAVVQDVLAADGHIPIRIRTGGTPRRRTAEVVSATDRVYDVARLAHLALGQQELDVVIQAIGRVRPYTRPREVVTFQCSARPDGDYDREFGTLAEARAFFGIPAARTRRRDETAARVRAERARGATQAVAAEVLCVSLRTVKRYWRSAGTSPDQNNGAIKPPEES